MKRPRSRKGRFVRATRRKARRNPAKMHRVRRRRRSRSRRRPTGNPPTRSRRPGQKGYKTPEAVKRKISLAVKRAMAGRKSGGGGGGARRGRRRAGGSRGRGLIGYLPGRNEFRRLFSGTTVKVALGAVGAGFLTSVVVNRFGQHLPGIAHPVGRVGWRLAIPLLGAALVRKYDQNIATGMVIGAAVSGVNELIRILAGATATVPVAAAPARAMGDYAGDLTYMGDDDDFDGYIDEGMSEYPEFSGMTGADAWSD